MSFYIFLYHEEIIMNAYLQTLMSLHPPKLYTKAEYSAKPFGCSMHTHDDSGSYTLHLAQEVILR
jgi:hypothetical protein